MDECKDACLKKTLSCLDLFALGFGAMIGWGWVVLVGKWLNTAGIIGTVLAFAIGGFVCSLVGLTYCELMKEVPESGGSLAFAIRFLGDRWGLVAGWSLTFGYVAVAAWESVAVITVVEAIWPLPTVGHLWRIADSDVWLSHVAVSLAVGVIIAAFNYRGSRLSAGFQNGTTAVLVVAGVSLILAGLVRVGVHGALLDVQVGSAGGVLRVAAMVPFMLVGFDVIPQSMGEMRVTTTAAGRVVMVSLAAAVLWYAGISVSVGTLLPREAWMGSALPAADAMGAACHTPFARTVLVIGGLCGVLTSWNAFFMAGARVLLAMGRAGMLPAFGAVHPVYGTPRTATLAVGGLCLIAPLLGRNSLVWLANTASLGIMVAYMINGVCLERLGVRKRSPRLRALSRANMLVTGLFLLLYLPGFPGALTWPHEWCVVFGWGLLGFVLVAFRKRVLT